MVIFHSYVKLPEGTWVLQAGEKQKATLRFAAFFFFHKTRTAKNAWEVQAIEFPQKKSAETSAGTQHRHVAGTPALQHSISVSKVMGGSR